MRISRCILCVLLFATMPTGCAGVHKTSVANVSYDSVSANPKLEQLKPSSDNSKQVGVALALGGGGARGYATVGVLRVLQNQGVPIDLIAGTSAGSIAGALYAYKGDAAWAEKRLMDAKFFDLMDRDVLNMSGYHMINFINLALGKGVKFSDMKVPLIVVTTDMKNGEVFEIDKGLVAPAVASSAAVQGLIQPQMVYGRYLNDGGVLMNVPVDPLLKYKPKVVIAVDIGTDFDFELPYWRTDILNRSISLMMRRLSQLQEQKADVVIHPELGHASMFSLREKQLQFDMGEKAACCLMGKIKESLEDAKVDLLTRPKGEPDLCQEFNFTKQSCKIVDDRNKDSNKSSKQN